MVPFPHRFLHERRQCMLSVSLHFDIYHNTDHWEFMNNNSHFVTRSNHHMHRICIAIILPHQKDLRHIHNKLIMLIIFPLRPPSIPHCGCCCCCLSPLYATKDCSSILTGAAVGDIILLAAIYHLLSHNTLSNNYQQICMSSEFDFKAHSQT